MLWGTSRAISVGAIGFLTTTDALACCAIDWLSQEGSQIGRNGEEGGD